MSKRYKGYPEYKPSGVEWLGEVPKTWEVCRIKFFAELNPPKAEARRLANDTPVTFLPMEAIGTRGELDVSRTKKLEGLINGYTYVGDNDVIIAKITPCFENGKGAIADGLENGVAFATTEVIPLRCKQSADSSYLYYLLTSDPFHSLAEGSMYGAGGQKRVSDSFVAEYHFLRPPERERKWIAAFLDRETGKIDRMIGKQERMIELLKEKRQAVISHAVTKGLNPNAPMKDSGIEWLGEIPEHWTVTRLKHESSRIVDCPHETPVYEDDGSYLVIRTADVFEGKLKLSKARRVTEAEYKKRIRRESLLPDDIVYGREGERWGLAALVPQEPATCLGQRMMQFRISSENCPHFMMWHLNSRVVYNQGSVDTVGATSPHVNVETIKNYALARPPKIEQKAISSFINSETSIIDRLITKAEQAIELMKERRTALISAAVTGKIDVREEM